MKQHRRLSPTTARKFAFFTGIPVQRKVRWVAAKEVIALVSEN
ncbi:hypothetical protein NYZ99_10260 [Maribacter litopenaei]|uniref:Uncharacterized protein n=1 Tax=Maribacter litopenaei TaxID=2976127 RepID=A0ABY5YBU1_9FLAO|nr:hypothetical protein [Maribacter litopenaei]UWX56530.1 hypothetical protein NYZ99_10260 [Maribacter litopenaei]